MRCPGKVACRSAIVLLVGAQLILAGARRPVFAQSSSSTRQPSEYHLTDAPAPSESETPDVLGDLNELLDADLSKLASTEIVAPSFSESVTSVERQENTVGRTAAAIYVITSDMIRRSGVRTIPDALRLAPGVHVAQLDSNKWAISIRGMATRFSNKLLVQIDGRTVYTPLFAGVFWDVQDVLLEDVERIEVIRGPGAAMWGANAVNGVINIITKSSRKTTGIFAEAGGGNERLFSSARIGGDTRNGSWRVFTKWFDRDAGRADDFVPKDDWNLQHLGFRTDQRLNALDTVTLQGDYYDGDAGGTTVFPIGSPPYVGQGPDPQTLAGGNVLFRFNREFDADSKWSLQVYYDETIRDLENIGFREDRHTADVDFQRQTRFGQWHSVVWGLGYRNSSDRIRNDSLHLKFLPDRRSINRYSTFIQDDVTLVADRLYFKTGSKFSWNDFTGFEIQPTARLLYTPSASKSIWASVSRAVRVPSRTNDDLHLTTLPSTDPLSPPFTQFRGNRDFDSETLLAWELGIRSSPIKEFYWDFAAFYNRYNRVEAFRAGLPEVDPITGLFVVPAYFVNGATADTVGFEWTSSAQMTDWWTLRGAYSFMTIDVDLAPGVLPLDSTGSSIRNMFFFHSSWDLTESADFDLMGRYMDRNAREEIPSYFELDARFAWRPCDGFEFSLVGRNLLDSAHPEIGSDVSVGAQATQVQRELYGQAVWRY